MATELLHRKQKMYDSPPHISLRTLFQNTVGLGFVTVFIKFVRQRPFKHWACFRLYLALE